MADPGTSGSAFAVLFAAVDIYKPFVFYADEIYEREVEKTVTPHTGPLIINKCLALQPDLTKWKFHYDSAAAWFAAHYRKGQIEWLRKILGPGATEEDGLRLQPVSKSPGEKEEGLDTLNSLFLSNSIAISMQCGNTIWEYDNYCRDAHGRLPKKNDHNVDNGRYLVKLAGIIAGLTADRPLNSLRRKAKNTRDYNAGRRAPISKGRINLLGRIKKTYGE